MLKTILNLEGAQKLSRKEQKSIAGGRWHICCLEYTGPTGCTLWNTQCCDRRQDCYY